MPNPSPLSSVQQALRYLIAESKAVLMAEADIRDVLGHTNVNCFKRRVEEAEAVLASLPQPSDDDIIDLGVRYGDGELSDAQFVEQVKGLLAPLPQPEWQLMSSVPRDARWFIGKFKDGEVARVHYAQDLSGEDQPSFAGFFVKRMRTDGTTYFDEVRAPIAWMPDPPAPAGEGQKETT